MADIFSKTSNQKGLDSEVDAASVGKVDDTTGVDSKVSGFDSEVVGLGLMLETSKERLDGTVQITASVKSSK